MMSLRWLLTSGWTTGLPGLGRLQKTFTGAYGGRPTAGGSWRLVGRGICASLVLRLSGWDEFQRGMAEQQRQRDEAERRRVEAERRSAQMERQQTEYQRQQMEYDQKWALYERQLE